MPQFKQKLQTSRVRKPEGKNQFQALQMYSWILKKIPSKHENSSKYGKSCGLHPWQSTGTQ